MAGRQVFKGRLLDVRLERVRLPNGREVELELMHHPGAAAVVAVDADGRVALIRQYRYAGGGWLWEIPAGVLNAKDEAPAACAARELREEVGLEADELRPLGTIVTTPGFCDERIHLFLARGLHERGHHHEADELIGEMARVPLSDALGMVRRGEIVDAKTIAALHLAAEALGAAA